MPEKIRIRCSCKNKKEKLYLLKRVIIFCYHEIIIFLITYNQPVVVSTILYSILNKRALHKIINNFYTAQKVWSGHREPPPGRAT